MATILVVDDEPDIRALVQVNLELDGHRVLTAGDGTAALQLVRAEVPDLMLLDVRMPDVDGWTVLATVKAATDLDVNRIPVIMLTADDTADARVRGGIEGAIRFLSKPFTLAALREEVADALGGPPEPARRLRSQQAALEMLARMEAGSPLDASAPRPHLTRLEKRRPVRPLATGSAGIRPPLSSLTEKQRELLDQVRTRDSVTDVAATLGVSRSNVYASLRRISRKLGVATVPELLALARDGSLVADDDDDDDPA